jgi:nucleoid-associated protein EbfC
MRGIEKHGTRRFFMNMMKMMKQAATMQKKMKEVQDSLGSKTVEFSSGGGVVRVVATGDMGVKSIKIDPKVVDPEDVDMLEDLVAAAVDGALSAAKDMAQEEMAKVAGELGLPAGINLPI